MPRYLIARSFEVGEDQMAPVGRRSRELTEQEFPEVTWEHSHVVVDDEGTVRTFCVYGAPSEDSVRAHARALGDHGQRFQRMRDVDILDAEVAVPTLRADGDQAFIDQQREMLARGRCIDTGSLRDFAGGEADTVHQHAQHARPGRIAHGRCDAREARLDGWDARHGAMVSPVPPATLRHIPKHGIGCSIN